MLTLSMLRRLLIVVAAVGLVAALAWESSSAAAVLPNSVAQVAFDF